MAKSKDTATPQALADRLRSLPDGTKESAAYRRYGEGVTREAFRTVWLAERVIRRGTDAKR